MVKQWVGAQLDGRTVAELDRQAEARGISRSEAMRRALESWLEEALEAEESRLTRGEERHRQVMGRIDYLIGMQREMERRLGIGNKGIHRQEQSDEHQPQQQPPQGEPPQREQREPQPQGSAPAPREQLDLSESSQPARGSVRLAGFSQPTQPPQQSVDTEEDRPARARARRRPNRSERTYEQTDEQSEANTGSGDAGEPQDAGEAPGAARSRLEKIRRGEDPNS